MEGMNYFDGLLPAIIKEPTFRKKTNEEEKLRVLEQHSKRLQVLRGNLQQVYTRMFGGVLDVLHNVASSKLMNAKLIESSLMSFVSIVSLSKGKKS